MSEKNLWKSDILNKDAGFRVRVPTDLFLLCAHKINGPLSFILSFVYNHSTKNYGSHWLFLFLHTTIWPNYMVLFNLFFIYCTTIRPKLKILINSISYFTRPFDQKLVLINLFIYLYRTIWQKIRDLINLIFLSVHDHSTKN